MHTRTHLFPDVPPDRLPSLKAAWTASSYDPNRFDCWFELLTDRYGLDAPRTVTMRLDRHDAMYLMDGHYTYLDARVLGAAVRPYMELAESRGMGREFYVRTTDPDDPFDFESHLAGLGMNDAELGRRCLNAADRLVPGRSCPTGFVIMERLDLGIPDDTPRTSLGMPPIRAYRAFYDFKNRRVNGVFSWYELAGSYTHSGRDMEILSAMKAGSGEIFAALPMYVLEKLSDARDYPGIYGSARVWFLDFILDRHDAFKFVNAGIGATDKILYSKLSARARADDRKILRDPVTSKLVELPF